MCTPTGSLATSVMLPSSVMQPPPQALPDLPLGASSSPPMLAVDAPTAGLVAVGCGSGGSLDDDVTFTTSLLSMLVSGPPVPPLPPSGCYGSIFVSSAISESLGAAAEAVAAAARDLGDKPVKVLLPWYPSHAHLFDHTKPAKVMIPGDS